ncbi:MAG TPA: GntR family transcriptional regulator [Acidimicrobiales bacterium]|nr:GntR family transcriptional regulator [Acidimicrobiales bacterium]
MTPPADRSDGESKVEYAYSVIRSRIVQGEFAPGERLVMDRLAVELGLSSVPVREAIRRLEAEGFAEFERLSGARVARLDLAGFVESMEALAVLEAGAMRLAVPRVRRADLRDARRLHERMVSWLADLDSLDPIAFSEANRRLHTVLFSRCPNARLIAIVESEWDRLHTTTRSSFAFAPERAADSVEEHGRLLAAIENGGSPEEIESLVRAHRMAAAQAVPLRVKGAATAFGEESA